MPNKPKPAPVMADINVIPMADIMLCLLIIFMVVTPMLGLGIPLEMARVSSPTDLLGAEEDDAIIVAVTRNGVYFLCAEEVLQADLGRRVRDRLALRSDRTVFIKSDARALYGNVVVVVDEIRAAGVDRIGLLTERLPEARRRSAS